MVRIRKPIDFFMNVAEMDKAAPEDGNFAFKE